MKRVALARIAQAQSGRRALVVVTRLADGAAAVAYDGRLDLAE